MVLGGRRGWRWNKGGRRRWRRSERSGGREVKVEEVLFPAIISETLKNMQTGHTCSSALLSFFVYLGKTNNHTSSGEIIYLHIWEGHKVSNLK